MADTTEILRVAERIEAKVERFEDKNDEQHDKIFKAVSTNDHRITCLEVSKRTTRRNARWVFGALGALAALAGIVGYFV